MKSQPELVETRNRCKNPCLWTIIITIILVLILIVLTTIILLKQRSEKNDATHIHYTRVSTTVYPGGYEIYRLTVLANRNPKEQYKLLADFLRQSLFNKSNYEQLLPLCPIIFSMTAVDHPENWRGMLFGTTKPLSNIRYPYVCYLSVMPDDRRNKLGTILLNQFINEMAKSKNPPVTHIQLHANWENCRAQRLYRQCGFRCNEFTPNGYSKPFEPEYKFGHMIRMELSMTNIQDMKNVCSSSQAVKISQPDEDNYTKLCNQNIPSGTNRTCRAKNSTIGNSF